MIAAIETGQDSDIEIIPADPQGLDPSISRRKRNFKGAYIDNG